jgi:hypothetical protein
MFSVNMKVSNFSAKGFGTKRTASRSSLDKWANSLDNIKIREARSNLRSAAAYARKVMRNGIKRGTPTKVLRKNASIGIPSVVRSTKRKRIPSQGGRPPKSWTQNGKWGIKTIVFTKLDRYGESYAIGAKRFRASHAKYSRFSIPEMLEFGGSGQIKVFANRDEVKETSSIWRNLSKKGGKVPTVWKSARYKARPYSSIVLKPTLKKFNQIYGR